MWTFCGIYRREIDRKKQTTSFIVSIHLSIFRCHFFFNLRYQTRFSILRTYMYVEYNGDLHDISVIKFRKSGLACCDGNAAMLSL